MIGGGVATAIDIALRETMLFAAVGILIGGIDDFAVDLVYLALRATRRVRGKPPLLADMPITPPPNPRRIVIFVPAWDESRVIGAMLRTALARLDHPDYRLYVGTYPNDRATIDAVARVAETDPRIRLVIGDTPGPTTKGDCLNALWRALRRDEQCGERAAVAVVLHDAEDVVHAAELNIFDRLIGRYATVQLPVLPLIDRGSPLVAGHYCDEFAESHTKVLVVRTALGAGMPLAGVGCAISRRALDALAAARSGIPFDAASLTEDYELGLTIARNGGRGAFVRTAESPGGPPVAVRAYFPATRGAAVRQKARWMTGIALAGWDRIGWSRWSDWRDHWMRMRDRRAPLEVLVLGAAYLSLVLWTGSLGCHAITGIPARPIDAKVRWLLVANGASMLWRLAMRALFTGRAYGRREAMLAVPRALVANIIAMLAARRALWLYVRMLFDGVPRWEKTAHDFPSDIAGTEQR